MGRIGLAISPVDSNVIYATIESGDRRGGIFRSNDRGGSWEKRNDFDAGAMYHDGPLGKPGPPFSLTIRTLSASKRHVFDVARARERRRLKAISSLAPSIGPSRKIIGTVGGVSCHHCSETQKGDR